MGSVVARMAVSFRGIDSATGDGAAKTGPRREGKAGGPPPEAAFAGFGSPPSLSRRAGLTATTQMARPFSHRTWWRAFATRSWRMPRSPPLSPVPLLFHEGADCFSCGGELHICTRARRAKLPLFCCGIEERERGTKITNATGCRRLPLVKWLSER